MSAGRSGVRVNRSVTIPLDEIRFSFSTSGGPGGQHANRSATRVTLVWDVEESSALGPRQRQRVKEALRSRIDSAGRLRLTSDRYRSQMRNRQDALDRLAGLVADALRPRLTRRATTPTRAAKERRLREKRHRGQIKAQRRLSRPDLDRDA